MRRLLMLPLALLTLVVVSTTAFAQKRGDRSLITRQDLDEAGSSVSHALDAVQRLRPNWLRPPTGRTATAGVTDGFGGRANAAEPIVYIDERRQPTLESLRTVQVSKIQELKYMDQNKAVQMLGPGHEAGAILVKTGGKP
ncbi:MAG: hypothetical protein ACT4P7_19825 [Gemmatimonadaceae bacterium]